MRIVFMGTPLFAVASLKALVEDSFCKVVGVVTQPDRPKGRGKKIMESPVKIFAKEHGLPVLQPEKVKNPEAIELLRQLQPELIVVAAFGQFLPESILTMPKYGCINVHASLLPKYRGAAPIHYAILKGEKTAGVTIMEMAKGMDTGDMLKAVSVPIKPEMTQGELHDVLKEKGAQLLVDVIGDIAAGNIHPIKQNEAEVTFASLITRDMEKLQWEKSAQALHDQIRAFNPWPGSYTNLPNGKILKVWLSKVVEGSWLEKTPGTVVEGDKHNLVIATGEGFLQLTEVQPEGKNHMAANVFINGKHISAGDVLA